MISGTFTKKAQSAGIAKYNISSGNTQFLRDMIGNPIPMTPKKSPTGGNNLGPLIRHGLAKLSDNRKHYEITQNGLDYLEQVDSVMKKQEPQLAPD